MSSAVERDKANYRAGVDVLDAHNGIGSLCLSDLTETPLSVMQQGDIAAQEIRKLRAVVDAFERDPSSEMATALLEDLRGWQKSRKEDQNRRMAEYKKGPQF